MSGGAVCRVPRPSVRCLSVAGRPASVCLLIRSSKRASEIGKGDKDSTADAKEGRKERLTAVAKSGRQIGVQHMVGPVGRSVGRSVGWALALYVRAAMAGHFELDRLARSRYGRYKTVRYGARV